MDQLMLDVTHIPDVEEGDVVTVFGRDGGALSSGGGGFSLDQTINYETVCQITRGFPESAGAGSLAELKSRRLTAAR